MPLPDLDILVAIHDAGNLTAAAEQLDMPRPTLSRRLTKLEEEVGARLVHRTTRRVALTEPGQELYRHARPIVDAVDAARNAIVARDGVPRGLLRVSVPGANELLSRLFGAYMTRYPEVRVEIVAASRHVDLVGEGFDVAIRAGQLTGPSLISRRIGTAEVVAVAHPHYLERRGRPERPEDLVDHDCLVGFDRGETPVKRWPLRDGGTTPVTPRAACNSPEAITHLTELGLGIGLVPEPFVGQQLALGTLVHVLPEQVGLTSGMWLVYPERRLILPRVRAFIDHAIAWLEAHPIEAAPP